MSWLPEGRNTVSPYLLVADANATLEFLAAAFGAETLLIHRRPDGSVMHAEARIGGSVVMMGEVPAPAPAMVHVYVPDCADAYARAIAAGAAPVQPPTRNTDEPDAELRAGVTGPGGISWWMATAG